jgi:hypothetical protein
MDNASVAVMEMKITNIQQCMNQVAFAFKLKRAIENDFVLKDQIDIEVEVDGSSVCWPKNAFRRKDDLLALAGNTVNMSLASLAIAADEELDMHLGRKFPEKAEYPHNIRAIIFQIRNAHAHNPLAPTWRVTDQRYKQKPYSYKSGEDQISVDFERLNGQRIDYAQFNGFDHFWSLFDDAQQLVMSLRRDGR